MDPSLHLQSKEFNKFGSADEDHQVSIASRDGQDSLCGLPLKANGYLAAEPPGTAENSAIFEEFHRHATVGGIVVVDGLPYALTVAQPFCKPITVTQVADPPTDSSSSLQDWDGVIEEPCITWFEDAIFPCGHQGPSNQREKSNRALRSRESRASSWTTTFTQAGSFAAYRLGSLGVIDAPSENASEKDAAKPLDSSISSNWALVALDETLLLPNQYEHPASGTLTTVSQIQKAVNLGRTEKVLVLTRPDTNIGLLDKERRPVTVSGAALDLWTLSSRFNRSDVGSWVVQGDKLVGVVVVTKHERGDKYVVPVETLFADIKAATGAKVVRLPKYNEMERFKKLPQELDDEWLLLST